MQLNEEIRIRASRETIFAALNDPAVLQQSIPGCEELIKTSDTEFTATIVMKVGPVKAKFTGAVAISDLIPPESYTISGEGKAGPAGHAKGGAKIQLIEDGDWTLLKYQVEASIGGKLAQLGGRLIESTAKRLAGNFFETFEGLVTAEAPGDAESTQAIPAPAASGGISPIVWIVGAVIVLGLIIYLVAGN